ncbi:RNase H domain-containing protein [Trichonephila clavipes]|nr:RNase H domain-containing protein [Trichonephila clavipes]
MPNFIALIYDQVMKTASELTTHSRVCLAFNDMRTLIIKAGVGHLLTVAGQTSHTVPGHVGILGNEQADNVARSMSDYMEQPVCYQDLKTSIQHYVHHIWQETWDQQILNKLHSIHPSTSHWAALPVPRYVRLTRLCIGHTRFTHRHHLLGENSPECPASIAGQVSQSVHLQRIIVARSFSG